jgi:hypothetical protein
MVLRLESLLGDSELRNNYDKVYQHDFAYIWYASLKVIIH